LKLFVYFILVFGIFFASYLLFNQVLAGSIWPNTFYAKQEEYAVLRQLPIWKRVLDQISLPLIGVGIVILPGFIIYMVNTIKQHSLGAIAGWVWILGFLFMYAIRLPVIYQHGRYVIPVMPAYFVMGLVGIINVIDINSNKTVRRISSRIWVLLIGTILIVFWVVGAKAYAIDVAIIESEMVAVAEWIAENTDPDELIAVHDIGAIGYYGQRDILDLAGLVSPEVIPIIRDEYAIEEFLDGNEASYLVTFPGWYPYLVKQGELIFETEGAFSVNQGGENMVVYRWRNK
jgi:hypothetical protein